MQITLGCAKQMPTMPINEENARRYGANISVGGKVRFDLEWVQGEGPYFTRAAHFEDGFFTIFPADRAERAAMKAAGLCLHPDVYGMARTTDEAMEIAAALIARVAAQ